MSSHSNSTAPVANQVYQNNKTGRIVSCSVTGNTKNHSDLQEKYNNLEKRISAIEKSI